MKAGIFSIGLDTYWPQFDGLLDNLNGYHAQIRDRIAGMGIELVDAGMVDNVEKASGAAQLFKQQDVEVIFSSSRPMHCHRPCCQWCRKPKCRW